MPAELDQYLSDNPAPQSVDVLIADSNGLFRGKQFPGEQLAKLYKKGANFPLSLMFGDVTCGTPEQLLQPPLSGDPDRVYRPVSGSLRPVPWATVPTAQVLMRPTEKDGSNLAIDPRTLLEGVIKRLNDAGYFPVIALEGEFYLLDPSTIPPVPIKPESGWPKFEGPQVYALEPLQDVQSFLNQVKEVSDRQNIPMTSVVCEYGDGQFELNLDHSDDPLNACVEYLMLKHAIRNVASGNGQLASFMAKPLADNPGSGCHIHVSLLNGDGQNVFGEDGGLLKHAIGGLIYSMADSVALFAPFANSYRRYLKGGWSPSTANWGENHRGTSVRIPMSGTADRRLEHRPAGADANPYLLTAAVLAGMHHGLSEKLDPGEEVVEGQPETDGLPFPARWREAIERLNKSELFRNYLGDEFIDLYCRAKFSEEESFHAEISDRDYGWCLRTV